MAAIERKRSETLTAHTDAEELPMTTDDPDGGRAKPDEQLLFLEGQLDEGATVSGDVFQIGAESWDIHGCIAVGGEELIALYKTEDEARHILNELHSSAGTSPDKDPSCPTPSPDSCL